ncbi:MAG: hypothetical protein ACI4GW_03300 [Lachnospiraceae bacterium]
MEMIWGWLIGIITEWMTSWQGSGLFILFLFSLLYLFKYKEEKMSIILIFCISILILFFNPIFYGIMIDIFKMYTLYPRLLLCMPISIVIAYVCTELVCNSSNCKECNTRLIVGMLIVIFAGNCVYSTDQISKSENWYHIPSEAIDIVEALEGDSGNLEEVVVAMPYYPACRFVYLVDDSFHMPYGRRGWGSTGPESKELSEHLFDHSWDYDIILKDAYICNCNYLVVYKDVPSDGFLSYGCQIVGETDNYYIYSMKDYVAESPGIEEQRLKYIEQWGGNDWRKSE